MAINDITLTGGMRNTLNSLQQTAVLFDRTQTRLASGKKVNSALDDPINFFAAKGYTDRASDLNSLKDGMGEAIQAVKAADAGISSITELISQAKSLANSALVANSVTTQKTYSGQFNALLGQIDTIANDSIYKGTNLLKGGSLLVNFNESSTSQLTIAGSNSTSGGLGITQAGASWATSGDITASIALLDAATTSLRTASQTLSSNLAVVQTRQNFTTNMVNTLTKGAENLTLADMNEEGANLLMLQTRQSLSSTSLSLASQAAQSVLRLF